MMLVKVLLLQRESLPCNSSNAFSSFAGSLNQLGSDFLSIVHSISEMDGSIPGIVHDEVLFRATQKDFAFLQNNVSD